MPVPTPRMPLGLRTLQLTQRASWGGKPPSQTPPPPPLSSSGPQRTIFPLCGDPWPGAVRSHGAPGASVCRTACVKAPLVVHFDNVNIVREREAAKGAFLRLHMNRV